MRTSVAGLPDEAIERMIRVSRVDGETTLDRERCLEILAIVTPLMRARWERELLGRVAETELAAPLGELFEDLRYTLVV